MGFGNDDAMAFAKATLLKTGCPVINVTESDDQVEALLLTPSEHRSKLLNWAVNVILDLEAPGANNLDKIASVLRLPPDFTTGNESKEKQVQHWRLLARLLEATDSRRLSGSCSKDLDS